MFDDDDDPIATKLTDWLVGREREDPKAAEVYQGLGQVIQDVIYIISNIRTQLFDEAMEHLQILVNTIHQFSDRVVDFDRAISASIKILILRSSLNIHGSSTSFSLSGAKFVGN